MMTNDSKDQGREAFEAWWESLPGATGVEADKDYEADVKGWALMSWQAALATSASALARDEASVALTDEQHEILRWCSNYHARRIGEGYFHARICGVIGTILTASPAASSAATVSDAASVPSDKTLRTLVLQIADMKPQYEENVVAGMNLLRNAFAATTAGAQDERAGGLDAAWAEKNGNENWGHEPTAKGLFEDGWNSAMKFWGIADSRAQSTNGEQS